ncbi:MAG TPA: glycogen debranching N-terminal domain-containing protein [Geodermatophilus sp.]|nr:glycogen debranching N-terminal domain-containing protein [Geodermatophilus sp.]
MSLTAPAARDVRVRADQLMVPSGWSLLVTDPLGRLPGDGASGFYVDDTRVLSRERIVVDGREIAPFSCARVGSHALVSHVELGDGETLPPRALYLGLERFVGPGLRTRLRFDSYSDEPVTLPVCLELDADFADADEADQGRRWQCADVVRTWDDERRELLLRYDEPRLDRAVTVRVVRGEPRAAATALRFDVALPPRASATVEYVVEPVFDGRRRSAPPASFDEAGDTRHGGEPGDPAARARATVRAEATRLTTSHLDVATAWRTAVDDLAALALGEPPGPAAPIAGLPLYQQIFGRDTLTASWQALLATATPLRDSLRLNAAWVGRRIDDWRDEEPGKLLHQARRGPSTALGHDPLTAYYGDWATVPDFLVFLGQYWAWTADLDTVRELLPVARQALRWLELYGDLEGDGFLEYDTRSPRGVKNQGWKDSDDAIVDEHGKVVANPLAASELQAYLYAAQRHAAVVLAACGDRAYAATLWRRSDRLQRRFDDAFWRPDQHCYAMALDAGKRQVRSVSSNDAHLLVAGIVPRTKGPAVARRLMAADMFSGWGIRTLSADHPVYNPFSYHRGSVWPVEQGTAALGFARYGCWEELHRLAEGFFAAAAVFAEHRLPETIAGLPRDAAHPFPSIYPKSCSPQAWSASAVVAMVQALLALRPAAPARAVLVDPHLPAWLPELTLTGVQVGGTTATLHARRRRDGSTRVRITDATGPLWVIHRPTRQAARVRTPLPRGTRRGSLPQGRHSGGRTW